MILLLQKALLLSLRYFSYLLSYIFPVKSKRLLFNSFNGMQYSCNPKYVYLSLRKLGLWDVEWIWVYNPSDKLPENIKAVRYMSIEFLYYLITSNIIITNYGFKSFIKKPHGQTRIETWHGGGAYKKTDIDAIKNKFNSYKVLVSGRDVDYYISSCRAFSSCMSKAQNVDISKFMPFGMPRNDVLINENVRKKLSEKVRSFFSLEQGAEIILYAPTWRDDGRMLSVNEISTILDSGDKQKGRYLFYRAHYLTAYNVQLDNRIIDVSAYPDMQELLCAADVLITDYSSCMWDFSLMFKPCFIYATDIEQYKEDRDFYTPMSEWPFPIATNIKQLVQNMTRFDEAAYVEKVKQHHEALGSYEDGHACERVCRLIEEILRGEKA